MICPVKQSFVSNVTRRAGLDLEHRLEVGPERPDDLVTADPVVDRDRHYAGAPAGGVCGCHRLVLDVRRDPCHAAGPG